MTSTGGNPPACALLDHAVHLLKAGELVAFPTETVYGLGADARQQKAVEKIFAVKGRPSNNPLIVHLADAAQVEQYCNLDRAPDPAALRRHLAALSSFWPGPLSVVVPHPVGIAAAVSCGTDTLAVRVPNHPLALQLLREFGGPIAAPSANRSQYISPTTAEHVRVGLGAAVGCILDGGACQVGLESTVLALVGPFPQLLRAGAITREQLSAALGSPVAPAPATRTGDDTAPLLSPGLLAKHYSPHTPLRFLDQTPPEHLPARVGVILFHPRDLPFTGAELRVLSSDGDLTEVAARLFAALRELDQCGLDLIVTDTCPARGLGEAIMDRLLRASTQR